MGVSQFQNVEDMSAYTSTKIAELCAWRGSEMTTREFVTDSARKQAVSNLFAAGYYIHQMCITYLSIVSAAH